ncbi:MAG: hypothetical protein WCH76_07195 [Candidatus Riflemargulisbacteria bacterium]
MDDNEFIRRFGCEHEECRVNQNKVTDYEKALKEIEAIVENTPSKICESVLKIVKEALEG